MWRTYSSAGVASALTDQDADNAYNAVMAFADIAKKVKDLTPASFMTAVEHTSDLHTGLLPPLQSNKFTSTIFGRPEPATRSRSAKGLRCPSGTADSPPEGGTMYLRSKSLR